MKTRFPAVLLLILALAWTTVAANAAPLAGKNACTTLKDEVLTYSTSHYLYGTPIPLGYDPYGYNYQAHMFKGSYANAYLGGYGYPPYTGDDDVYLDENPGAENTWVWPYRNDQLLMKWNDAWLSNKDCNGDGRLDRPASYIGSGAWETNHMWGEYEGEDGETCNWDYFTKIIAVPSDAVYDSGVWYSADDTEIGPSIWGSFATIFSVYNDPCAGLTGLEYRSPDHAGFGGW